MAMQHLRSVKQWLIDFDLAATAVEDLETIHEFYKEEAATDADLQESYTKAELLIEKLEFKNMLSNEGDDLSAVLQITSGAG